MPAEQGTRFVMALSGLFVLLFVLASGASGGCAPRQRGRCTSASSDPARRWPCRQPSRLVHLAETGFDQRRGHAPRARGRGAAAVGASPTGRRRGAAAPAAPGCRSRATCSPACCLDARCPPAMAGQLSLVAGVAVIDAIRSAAGLAPAAGCASNGRTTFSSATAKMGGILVESTSARGSRASLPSSASALTSSPPPTISVAAPRHFSPHTACRFRRPSIVLLWPRPWTTGSRRGTTAAALPSVREAWLERAGPIGEPLSVNARRRPLSAGALPGSTKRVRCCRRIRWDGSVRFSYGDVTLGDWTAHDGGRMSEQTA